MKTILIAKGGSVYRTRAAQHGNATGEQGETEGVIRHLLERNDINLVYFGAYRGEVPDGLTVIAPDIDRMNNQWALGSDQEDGFRNDNTTLAHLNPCAFIQTAGYSPTFSMINNPNGATVQSAAIRYTAPMHNALNHFKIPRIVINNDPRTYPRDQEMSKGWPHSKPAALLDQCDKNWNKIVGGTHYRCRSVHARCESWAYHEPSLVENSDMFPAIVLAHAHFKTGIKNGDQDAWDEVFPLPDGTQVYGEGWEHYHKYSSYIMPGKCKPENALVYLSNRTCCPVVSHTPGFYTGKPWVLMSRGCIPVLHHSYDPKYILLGKDSPMRIRKSGDFLSIANGLHRCKSEADSWREFWKIRLQPNWTLLDRLVDTIVEEKPISFETFGGYI